MTHRSSIPKGNQNPTAITVLVDSNANPNAKTKKGLTPLHIAARRNQNPEVITALLDAGAAANAQTAYGELPFDYAKDNQAIRESKVYWRLNDARF